MRLNIKALEICLHRTGRVMLVIGFGLAIACSEKNDEQNGQPDGGQDALAQGTDASTGDAAPSWSCDKPPANSTLSKERAWGCNPGTLAADYVKTTPYTRIDLEIDYQVGAKPPQAAFESVKTLLADLLGKPANSITYTFDDELQAASSPLSPQAVRDIERGGAREEFSSGDRAVIYLLSVNQGSTDDKEESKILGHAYAGSSVVLYYPNLAALTGGPLKPKLETVVATVVMHELGHLCGLVNLGTSMVEAHEDSAHPGHDTSEECIMHYKNQSGAKLSNLLTGGKIPDFCSHCKADIAASAQ